MPLTRHCVAVLFVILGVNLTLPSTPASKEFPGLAHQAKSQPDISYNLLWKLEDNHTSWINIRISIDTYIDVAELKHLVCTVVRREKPENFKYVRIFVYYSVTEYQTYIVDKKLTDHIIATYVWNRTLVGNERVWQLMVSKDSEGREYRYEDRLRLHFNHETECQECRD